MAYNFYSITYAIIPMQYEQRIRCDMFFMVSIDMIWLPKSPGAPFTNMV